MAGGCRGSSIEGEEFLDYLRDCQFLKKHFALRISLLNSVRTIFCIRTLREINFLHEEIKSRLNSGNASCHSV
jgi:hypothetical protein